MEEEKITQHRLKMRCKCYLKWVNFNLSKKGCSIDDISNGFNDGLMMIKLVEILSGRSIGKKIKEPKTKMQKLENHNLVIKFLEKNKKLSQKTFSAFDLIGGDVKSILDFIWGLIKRFIIEPFYLRNKSEGVEISSKRLFIKKFREKIDKFTKDIPEEFLQDDNFLYHGISWCALIANWNNSLLDLPSLDKKDDPKNFETVFRTVEENLGVPNFLDVEDFDRSVEKPDINCIVTYGLVIMENSKKLKRSTRGSIMRRSKKKMTNTLKETSREGSSTPSLFKQKSIGEMVKQYSYQNMSTFKVNKNNPSAFMTRESSAKMLLSSKIDEIFSDKENVEEDFDDYSIENLKFSRKIFDELISSVKSNIINVEKQREILNDILLMKNSTENSMKRLKQLLKLNLENKEISFELTLFIGMLDCLCKLVAGIKMDKEGGNKIGAFIKKMIALLEKIEMKTSISLKQQILGNNGSQQLQMVDLLNRHKNSINTKERKPRTSSSVDSAITSDSILFDSNGENDMGNDEVVEENGVTENLLVDEEKPIQNEEEKQVVDEKPSQNTIHQLLVEKMVLPSPRQSPRDKINLLQKNLQEAKLLQMQQEYKFKKMQHSAKVRLAEIKRLVNKLNNPNFSVQNLLLDSIFLINLITFPNDLNTIKLKLRNKVVESLIQISQNAIEITNEDTQDLLVLLSKDILLTSSKLFTNDISCFSLFNGSMMLLKEVLERIFFTSIKTGISSLLNVLANSIRNENISNNFDKKRDKIVEVFEKSSKECGRSNKIGMVIFEKVTEIFFQFKELIDLQPQKPDYVIYEEKLEDNMSSLSNFVDNIKVKLVDLDLLTTKITKLLVMYEDLKNSSSKTVSSTLSEFIKTVALFSKNLIMKLSPKTFSELTHSGYIDTLINVLQTVRMDCSLVENVDVRLDLVILSQEIVFSFAFLLRCEHQMLISPERDQSDNFEVFKNYIKSCKTDFTKFLKILKEILKINKPKEPTISNPTAKQALKDIEALYEDISRPYESILLDYFDKKILLRNKTDKNKVTEYFSSIGKSISQQFSNLPTLDYKTLSSDICDVVVFSRDIFVSLGNDLEKNLSVLQNASAVCQEAISFIRLSLSSKIEKDSSRGLASKIALLIRVTINSITENVN